MSSAVFWILLLYTLAGVAESTKCWVDNYNYIYCPDSGCCGTYGNQYCCAATGTIVGSVIGSLAFVIIVVSIITCCCCACCPVYQYRTQGTVITTSYSGPSYQTMPDTSPYPANTGPYQPNTGPYPSNTGPYTAKPAGAYMAPPPYQN